MNYAGVNRLSRRHRYARPSVDAIAGGPRCWRRGMRPAPRETPTPPAPPELADSHSRDVTWTSPLACRRSRTRSTPAASLRAQIPRLCRLRFGDTNSTWCRAVAAQLQHRGGRGPGCDAVAEIAPPATNRSGTVIRLAAHRLPAYRGRLSWFIAEGDRGPPDGGTFIRSAIGFCAQHGAGGAQADRASEWRASQPRPAVVPFPMSMVRMTSSGSRPRSRMVTATCRVRTAVAAVRTAWPRRWRHRDCLAVWRR